MEAKEFQFELLFTKEINGDSIIQLKDGKIYFIVLKNVVIFLYIMKKLLKNYIKLI